MKILYAGTPQIAVPLLEELSKNFEVCAVLTSTDKRAARSSALLPSPVKLQAQELNIPVLQYDSLKQEARAAVTVTGADTLISFAYGKIFGPKFLALFKNAFNVHPSKLPLLRGPSPVVYEIINCFREGAISFQNISLAVDEGDIWACHTFDLNGTETTESLTEKVSLTAARFVPSVLEKIQNNEIQCYKQLGEPTYSSMITAETAQISFDQSAEKVHAFIRAMYPWPKAWATVNGVKVIINSVYGDFNSSTEPFKTNTYQSGQITGVDKNKGLGVACSDGIIYLTSLQLPTKKALMYKDFVNGNQWILGQRFNT